VEEDGRFDSKGSNVTPTFYIKINKERRHSS